MNKTMTMHTIFVGEREMYGAYAEVKRDAYAELGKYDDNEKVSFLWYRQTYRWNERMNCYVGTDDLTNIASYYAKDGSNWKTVRELGRVLGFMRLDGQFSENETFVPERMIAEDITALEELKDD